MKLRKKKVPDQTLHDAIRGSVPNGKLAKARIVLSDAESKSQLVGCTLYGTADVVERLDLPRGRDHYSSTVRSHETRHATFSKRWSAKIKRMCRASEKMAIAVNIIEDCYVEQKPLPRYGEPSALRNYCREHYAAALRDVHEMKLHKAFCDRKPKHEANTPCTRNGRIMCAARAMAMLQVYRHYADAKRNNEAVETIAAVIGEPTFEVLHRVISMSKCYERRIVALRLLAALLEDEEGDDIPDVNWPIPLIEGTGKGVGMKIRDLVPKSEWTSHDKKVTIKPAPSGSIVRVNRYVNAIVSGDACGLFSRRLRQNPSGTVLIDASGSMHATVENLKRLCKLIPDATVAYYSGDDVSKGVLAIYSEKMKRYNGELPVETLLGGNSIDMEAMQWLVKQPQPWTLISDLQFCGSSFGGEEVAHAIVDRETTLKRLTVIPTFKKAFEIFESRKALVSRKIALPDIVAIRARTI